MPIDRAAPGGEGAVLFARPWQSVIGVAGLEQLPAADRPEIAFAGRSNVGKSSLINAIVGQRHLARTSNTPGRTQQLNFFRADDVPLYLVDLPGYGYAAAPKDKVDTWTRLVRDYLGGRPSLARVYLLIDARHGVKEVDRGIMKMLDDAAVSYQLVLTKLDKLSEKAGEAAVAAVAGALARHPAAFPEVIATSSEKGTGIEVLRAAIATLLAERGHRVA